MAAAPRRFNSPLDDNEEEEYEAFDMNTDYKDAQFGEDGEFYYSEKKDTRP